MGSIRTFLALVVVLTHSYGDFVFIGGQNAVRLFYVISGFLISYVLTEVRSYPSVRTFYVNRILRIYPIYFVVALITLAAYFAMSYRPFLAAYAELPREATVLVSLSNGLLVGQDWLMFTAIKGGAFVFSTNFWNSEVLIYKAFLVPQAWTLGVELTFYLLAPFVVVSKPKLFVALALSLLIRLALLRSGLGWNDPWNYRFFPSELCLFLTGALSQQYLLPIWKGLPADALRQSAPVVVLAFIVLCMSFAWLPLSYNLKNLALFGLFALIIPATFLFQASTRWDRAIGELSYPIYICHMLVLVLVERLLANWAISNKVLETVLTLIGSIAFAALLNKIVAAPLERLRNIVRARRSNRASASSLSSV